MKKILKPLDRTSSDKCFVCGPDNPKGLHLEFYLLDEETVAADLTPPPEWCGWEGLMHGGLQCVLLDEVTAWAITGLLNQAHFLTTGLDVKYRRPVRLDQKLTITGRIIRENARGSRVEGRILNQDGEVLSQAVATILHVGLEKFHDIVDNAP